MNFKEYQEAAMSTRLPTADINYAVLNLAGEAGEVASKLAKAIRDSKVVDRNEVAKELGDCVWCITLAAIELGFTLEQVAEMNIKKLADRNARSVLAGSGDNR